MKQILIIALLLISILVMSETMFIILLGVLLMYMFIKTNK